MNEQLAVVVAEILREIIEDNAHNMVGGDARARVRLQRLADAMEGTCG